MNQLLVQPPLWFAFALSAAFAVVTWQMRWLTRSGAVSTLIVGGLIYGLGGWLAAAPLLVFFISSSLLSKIGKVSRAAQGIIKEKGSTRDAAQVWANGGIAVALVVSRRLLADHMPLYRLDLLPLLYLAVLATVNADTWATELGRLSGVAPRSLRDWKPALSGTSGAISLPGTLASLAGALIIPLSVYRFWSLDLVQFVCIAWAGFLGCFIDSLLGAGIQAMYRDPATGAPTERAASSGKPMLRQRGIRWINNDAVNFLASLGGVACAYVLLRYAAQMVF